MMLVEEDPRSSWLFDLHKSLGIAASTLILLRIFWRVGHALGRFEKKEWKLLHRHSLRLDQRLGVRQCRERLVPGAQG